MDYNMPKLSNKTAHGLTDIVIAWDQFKPVFIQIIFGNNGTSIYCALEWNWRPSIMVGADVKFFLRV